MASYAVVCRPWPSRQGRGTYEVEPGQRRLPVGHRTDPYCDVSIRTYHHRRLRRRRWSNLRRKLGGH